jgi:hypothetical protein
MTAPSSRTADEKVQVFRDIVTGHSFQFVADGEDGPVLTETRWDHHEMPEGDGELVDMQTANVIVQVYDRLNEQNRETLMSKKVATIAHICWKAVRR